MSERLKQRRPRRAHPQLPKPPPARNPARFRVQAEFGFRTGSGSGPRSADGLADGLRWPGGRGKFFRRKKVCKFCTERSMRSPTAMCAFCKALWRARQDRTPAAHWRLHHAPARLTRAIKQPEHRPAAVCYAALTFGLPFAGSYPLAVSGADLAEGYIVMPIWNRVRPLWLNSPSERTGAPTAAARTQEN